MVRQETTGVSYGIIYLMRNIINDKIYIGQTVNFKRRILSHKGHARSYARARYKGRSHLYSAMNKYGLNNFEFSILDTAKNQEELDKVEGWWIEIFRSTNQEIGYNIEDGGKGKGRMPEEMRRILSEKYKGSGNPHFGKHHSEETRRIISEKHSGENSVWFGKHHTEDTKRKMSNSGKGKHSDPIPQERIQRMRETRKGEMNSNAKLTRGQVDKIRQEYETGLFTYKSLGTKYGVKETTIAHIIKHIIWK